MTHAQHATGVNGSDHNAPLVLELLLVLELDGLCLFDTLRVHDAIMLQNKIVERPSTIHSVVLVVLQFLRHGEPLEVEEEQWVSLRREHCLVQLKHFALELRDRLVASEGRLVAAITHVDH